MMPRYALVDPNDAIVREVPEERLDLNAGTRAGYRWLPIQVSVTDNSTLPERYKTRSRSKTVQGDHVALVTTIGDMDATEIEAVNDQMAAAVSQEDIGKLLLTVFRKLGHVERVLFSFFRAAGLGTTRAEYYAWLQAQVADDTLTGADFRTTVDDAQADEEMISAAAFLHWLKQQLREDG